MIDTETIVYVAKYATNRLARAREVTEARADRQKSGDRSEDPNEVIRAKSLINEVSGILRTWKLIDPESYKDHGEELWDDYQKTIKAWNETCEK
jgi:hypothetical protein